MATIYDVAAKAGVSLSSVSAVLNNKRNKVGGDTRQRILEAVRDLDYRPSRVARQLATGRSNTIAVTFGRQPPQGASFHAVSGVLAGAVDAAAEIGLYILISPANPRGAFAEVVTGLHSHGVDAAVVVGPVSIDEDSIAAIDNCGIPVVCIDSYPGFKRASTVDFDNAEAMAGAVAHLVCQGHERIVYVGHPPVHQCFVDRARAFFAVMESHGIQVGGRTINVMCPNEAGEGLLAALKTDPRPTAVVCDESSFGASAWEAIEACGLRVPEDISLFVFDGLLPGHPGAERISRCHADPYRQGKAATETISRVLAGEISSPVHIKVPLELVMIA